MPVYEYQCTRCGHRFEAVHPVGEAVERCERCGAPVRRVFSPVGIIFKGSGFYVNDNRKTPVPSEGDGKASGTEKAPAAAKTTKGDGSAASSSSGGTKSE